MATPESGGGLAVDIRQCKWSLWDGGFGRLLTEDKKFLRNCQMMINLIYYLSKIFYRHALPLMSFILVNKQLQV